LNVGANAKSMTVSISGGTGNADIILLTPNDKAVCRTRAAGNTDACSILSPAAGAWKIRLNGKEAYSGVTLRVTTLF
jgi:hypothetical protein